MRAKPGYISPVREGEDGVLVARRGGELGEGHRGVPAGEDRDGGVLGGRPLENISVENVLENIL